MRELVLKISRIMPTIILSGTLFFLAMQYNGHIELMGNHERQEKLTQLNNIIEEEGCIPNKEAKKRLDLTKHEFVEVYRNASGYPYIVGPEARKNSQYKLIFDCYMLQTSETQKYSKLLQSEKQSEDYEQPNYQKQ